MAKDKLTEVFTNLGFEVSEDYGTWIPQVDSIILTDKGSGFKTIFKWKDPNNEKSWYLEQVGPRLKAILLRGIGFDRDTHYGISSLDNFIKQNEMS
jgi:hypothetical protein